MKDLALKFLMVVVILCSVISCGNRQNNKQTNTINGSLYGYAQIINNRQLDSICVVDELPRNLSEWISSSYTDYETGKKTTKSVYIKELNEEKEVMYILIPRDTLYKITKRIGVKD